MATILDKILETKRRELVLAKQQVSADALERQCAAMPATRDFHGALAKSAQVRIIAEVKKASPSAGVIRADFDPVPIAKAYAAGGAACLSVLTDRDYFQGDLQFLRDIRQAVSLPLLRKDFIIDRYQLLEARAAGADCVLLIAECLSPDALLKLHQEASELGLQTLIELYDSENLPAVLATGGPLVGVNNRDLRSFHVDLEHTIRLRQEIPRDRLLVGESGIRTADDVRRLGAAGVKAILVGESLMRQQNIEAAVAELADVVASV
jgi:indole-3-glycerol phosphate synthase